MKPRFIALATLSILLLVTAGTPLLSQAVKTDNEAVYQHRAADLDARETTRLIDLALWAQRSNLDGRARQLALQALSASPGDKRATELYNKLNGGNWKTRTQKVELKLTDGSMVYGEAPLDYVVLDSEYGRLRFPAEHIDLIVFKFADDKDLLIAHELTMLGRAGISAVETTTKLGKATVDSANLRELRLVHACDVCNGKLKITCPTCQGKGAVEKKRVCPDCNGVDSKKPCPTCKGRGKTKCDLCNGKGKWRPRLRGFRGRSINCPKCGGTGALTCPDCGGTGEWVCRTCKGTGFIVESIVCPDCNGAKIVDCPACKGTGVRPRPTPVWPIPPNSTPTHSITETP